MAPATRAFTYSEWTLGGGRRERAVAAAVADSEAGDIVLLEMQTTCCGRSSFSPAETSQAIWLVVRTGADAGVVVVAAAGNGDEDLDSEPYEEYRERGDSGAIIVGAGDSTIDHRKLSFSTFGSRLTVQAWGQNVMTAGYGVCEFPGSEDVQRHYTPRYSGTSSASDLVAGAVTAIQSYAQNMLGERLGPEEMRALLERTGLPQQGAEEDGTIGPFLQMRAAIEELRQRRNGSR